MIEKHKITRQCSEAFEWEKWRDKIPYLSFPAEWEVKIIPPLGSAIVRFWIRLKAHPAAWVSVYLDCYDQLGYVGEPYWEIYPDNQCDNLKFIFNQTDGMLLAIAESLEQQKNKGLNHEKQTDIDV